jgi:hypothetical protein
MLYFGFTKLKHNMSKGMETHGKKNGEIKFVGQPNFRVDIQRSSFTRFHDHQAL